MKRNRKLAEKLITFGIVIAAFLLCKILIGTGVMSRSLRGQLIPICVYICMAVSLNLTVGISGELSLGHAGFMSVGAFSGIVPGRCGRRRDRYPRSSLARRLPGYRNAGLR